MKLRVSAALGLVAALAMVVTGVIQAAPPTVGSGGPYSVIEGQQTSLTATGNAESYSWDLNNNGTFETAGQSVTFPGPDPSFGEAVLIAQSAISSAVAAQGTAAQALLDA